jgi:hypothetical protein
MYINNREMRSSPAGDALLDVTTSEFDRLIDDVFNRMTVFDSWDTRVKMLYTLVRPHSL